jgi:hypothetical protein
MHSNYPSENESSDHETNEDYCTRAADNMSDDEKLEMENWSRAIDDTGDNAGN